MTGTGWQPPPSWTTQSTVSPAARAPVGAFVAIGFVLVVIFGVTIGVTGAKSSRPGTGSPGTSASGSPTGDLPIPLAGLFPPSFAGYLQLPDTVAGSGPLTEDTLAKQARNPSGARTALETAGFLGGYERQWVDIDARHGYRIRIYHFISDSGAQYYNAIDLAGTAAAGATEHDDASTGAAVFHVTARDSSDNWAQVAIATTDVYVVAVRQWSAEPIDSDSFVVGVTAAQLGHLY